jgi:hypothetical protein
MQADTLDPALVARLQRRHALTNERRGARGEAALDFSVFLSQLCSFALDQIDKRDQEKGLAQTPATAPAPVVVSLTVTEQAPPAPVVEAAPVDTTTQAAALWREIVERVRVAMGADAIALQHCAPHAYEGRALLVRVPTPYWASDLQERLGGWFSRVATQVVGDGHLIEVAFVVDPAYFERTAQAEAHAETREAERAAEDLERNKRAAHLVTLYARRDVESAKEAGRLLVEEPDIIDMLPATSRKLITEWATSTAAGADYQAGKEAEYRGPRKGGRR